LINKLRINILRIIGAARWLYLQVLQECTETKTLKLCVDYYVLTHSPFEIFVRQNASETSVEIIHLECIEIKYVTVFKFSDNLCNLASGAIV